jgi:hypothetical protein
MFITYYFRSYFEYSADNYNEKEENAKEQKTPRYDITGVADQHLQDLTTN